jgi:GntR family transcriptional regulator
MNRRRRIAMDDSRPIFLQIAEAIENDILEGRVPEESQVPSTNEFAAFHRINPATAGKGMGLLVDRGILYKKRGIGMFVVTGARATIAASRREQFESEFIGPLLAEAEKLGLGVAEVVSMIRKGQGA